MAIHIADVRVIQSHFPCDLVCLLEARYRCRWQVFQQILGMKAREVNWNVGAKLIDYPGAKARYLLGVVIQRGEHQVYDLKPDARVFQQDERVEDRLQFAVADIHIILLIESF